jgi:threonine dehydratase
MQVTNTTTTPELRELAMARTERQVLDLIVELEDHESWLHRQFYGASGVVPTRFDHTVSPLYGHRVLLKNETAHILNWGGNAYHSASFKRRGALLAGILSKRANPRLTHFVTASHGNHGIGVAMAAKTLGVKTEVFCPESVNAAKLKRLRTLGAVVHTKGLHSFEDALAAADVAASRKNAFLIHPYDQPEVMAGQATIALEIVRDLIALSARGLVDLQRAPIEIDVAVAGGGLLTGMAIVLKRYKDMGILGKDNVRLFGVQMRGCDAARRSVQSLRQGGNGKAVFQDGEFNDACDSTAVREVGMLTLPFMANPEYVQGFRLVSESQVGRSMKLLSDFYDKRVEPAGALAYAAVRQHAAQLSRQVGQEDAPTTFIVPVCGANVTRDTYDYFQAVAAKEYDAFKC